MKTYIEANTFDADSGLSPDSLKAWVPCLVDIKEVQAICLCNNMHVVPPPHHGTRLLLRHGGNLVIDAVWADFRAQWIEHLKATP